MTWLRPQPLWILVLFLAAPLPCQAADAPYHFDQARQFMDQHCIQCHGGEKTSADLDLTAFKTQESVLAKRQLWDEILHRVGDREMPPPSRKRTPPPEKDRLAFVAWITQTMHQAACEAEPTPGPAPLRRLNKSQYRATIRDLLGVHFDASQALPEDGAGGEGFDNAAETLFLSPVYAEKYLEAARQALGYAARNSDSRRLLLIASPDERTTPEEAARRVLANFARRAYRRPVRAEEVDRLLSLFQREQQRGQAFDRSIFYALQGVLISPHFLFRVEEPAANPDKPTPLNDFELATRLSYFLWNSMPDEELFRLAEEGKLHEEQTLRRQMSRMLRDRKVREFAQSFAEQWLETRRLGTEIKPERKLFPRYDQEFENALKMEPVLFLQEILSRDRSLLELIDADYTYANRELARHYGLGPVEGFGQLNRVSLPKDSPRGGVLTMAGVLTVSSYPHRTSPVLRGAWVLENILGTPPPPPPPNVPPLPENKQGAPARTVRERLLAHRQNPTCATCHDRIDPIGFGLENFDAIGRWRDREAGQPVDAHGRLPDGTEFDGPVQLKQALLKNKEQFLRHFSTKMLGYALGRGLIPEDHCVIDRIVEQLTANDFRSHTMIWEIINSVPFRSKPTLTVRKPLSLSSESKKP